MYSQHLVVWEGVRSHFLSLQVSCIALNHSRSLLASGQSGPLPLVRLWGVESARCLALFKTHSSGLHSLRYMYMYTQLQCHLVVCI